MWRHFNALRPERPMMLVNPEDSAWGGLLSPLCKHPMLRKWEMELRRRILRHKYVGDDFVVTDSLDIQQVLEATSIGLESEIVHPDEKGGAYTWEQVLRDEHDLDKFQFQTVSKKSQETQSNYQLASDIFGDILKVRIRGGANIGTWFMGRLSFFRGLEQLMIDLYDNPDLIHRAMAFQRDNMNRMLDQYESMKMLSLNTLPEDHFLMGGSAHTTELPQPDHTGEVRLKDLWGYGECQEFVSVGPEQFLEFSLQYEAPVLRRFGLVAYGCCEPLDQKFDHVIRNLPNLRLVSVSPWCDRRIAAEKLGDKYIYAWKPNPSLLCGSTVDWSGAENLIRETLRIARGCHVEIIMKDLQNLNGDISRLKKWAEIAIRAAEDSN